jgi:hypothetical protein
MGAIVCPGSNPTTTRRWARLCARRRGRRIRRLRTRR